MAHKNKTVLIPDQLIQDPTAPAGTVRLYACLADCHENGKHDPSVREICKAIHMSRMTVIKYLNMLEDEGYITREKNPGFPDIITLVGYPEEGSDNYGKGNSQM